MPPNLSKVPEFLRFVSHYRPTPIKGQPLDVQKIQGALQKMGNIPRDSRLLSDQIAQKAQVKRGSAQLLLPDLQTPSIITPKQAKIVVPKRYLQKGVTVNDYMDDGDTYQELLYDIGWQDPETRRHIFGAVANHLEDIIAEEGIDSVPNRVLREYKAYKLNPTDEQGALLHDVMDTEYDPFEVVYDAVVGQRDRLIREGIAPDPRSLMGTQWDPFGEYQRLPELPGDEYFTSMLRGTPVPKGHDLSGSSEHFLNPSQYGHVRGTYNPKAKLVKIDELQSDPLEVDSMDPRLKNIYGQLGKAMIQGAAETDQAGVMFPTAKAIESVRSPRHREFYQKAYDRDLQDQLFDPLSDLGISIGKTDNYRGVNLDPKAKETLKNNPDFYNYAEGGLLDFPPELSSEINDYLKKSDPQQEARDRMKLFRFPEKKKATFKATPYGKDLAREGQHIASFNSQAADKEKHQAIANLKHAASNWLTDVPASIGDLADMGYYGARKVLSGQSEKPFASLGWGPAIRQKLRGIPDSSTPTMSDADTPLSQTIGELANPLLFMNPKHWANPKMLGALAALHGVPDMGLAGGALGVIKPKGGLWEPTRFSPTGRISNLLKSNSDQVWSRLPEELRLTLEGQRAPHSLIQEDHPQEWLKAMAKVNPMDAWVSRQLKNYLERDFASPNDVIRKLADDGIAHVAHDPLGTLPNFSRTAQMGKTELGKTWENLADNSIRQEPAYMKVGDHLEDPSITGQTPEEFAKAKRAYYNAFEPGSDPTRKINPQSGEVLPSYLNKVPADESVHGLFDVDHLGFDHLVDELTNALRGEASGLPRNLQLTPEAVNNMSVEKAVRRVSDINNWREAQAIETNKALASNPAVHLVREYPDTPEQPNPKGLRWVEIKPGELPAGYTEETLGGPRNSDYRWHYPDPKTGEKMWTSIDPRRQALEPQLKYEGDTMKHCVGGYCDDVLSGDTRIFSLRDANGEPHTTVEVGSKLPWTSWEETSDAEDFLPYMSKKHGKRFSAFQDFEKWNKLTPEEARDLKRNVDDSWDYSHWFAHNRPDLVEPSWYGRESWPKPGELNINQIKGKANQKPKDEYLPFVQDFVRNGLEGKSWGNIKDFQNTGLVDMGEFTGNHITGYYTPDEAIKAVQEFEANNPGTYGAWITELEKMKAPNGN